MKRGARTQFDIKPQTLKISVLQTAANVTTEVSVPIGSARFTTGKDRAIVMEILKVRTTLLSFESPNITAAFAQVALSSSSVSALSTALIASSGRTISAYSIDLAQSTNVGKIVGQYPVTIDTTDGNGNGILVASDSLFVLASSVAMDNAVQAVVEILYRFVEVSTLEFIGIVAAMNNST